MSTSKRPPPFLGDAFKMEEIKHEEEHDIGVNAARCEPMSQIADHLFIGSWRDVEDPATLRANGITHILNVAKEVDPLVRANEVAAFSAHHIPLADEHRENILNYMEEACAFIEDAKSCGGKCLVHCRRGISRSPAIVVGYLMRHEEHEYDSAVEYVKLRRTCVSLNIAFREFLMTYDTPQMKQRKHSERFSDETDDFDRDQPSQGGAPSRFCDFDDHEAHGPTPGTSESEGGAATDLGSVA